MRLLQLVPGFGRLPNGIFDYSRVLENELAKKDVFSFYDPQLAREADAIFLNYSGYGYQKRGLPIKLYLELRHLVRTQNIPLFIYFHELYASSDRLINSSFWLYPFQKKLCYLLLDLSTASFCGNEVMYDLLKRGPEATTKKLNYASLFSNIPVLENNRMNDQRENVAVVFGSPGRRAALYSNATMIGEICKRLGIVKIIDIGNGDMSKYWALENISFRAMGVLSHQEVAIILQTSQFGFLSYVEHLFGKSGIFAAFAGNGLTVINFPPDSQLPRDGLVRGIHYLNAADVPIEGIKKNKIDYFSNNIFSWYQPRNSASHAKIIYETLEKYK